MDIKEQYYCPVCGTHLNVQKGFNDESGEWLCSSCLSYVSLKNAKNKFFNGVFFDNSEPVLIEEHKEEVKHEVVEVKKEEPVKKEKPVIVKKEVVKEQLSKIKEDVKKHKKERQKGDILKTIVFLLVCVIIITCLYFVLQLRKLVSIGIASDYMSHYTYQEVVSKLEEAGFSNITLVPVYDLDVEDIHKDNKIKEVKIGKVTEFTSTKKFLCDDEITISYHSLKPIPIGLSHDIVSTQNYATIVKKLEKSGFVNIKVQPIYDLYLGLFIKDGSISEMTIDGKKKFEANDKFKPTAEIIITYHTFKKEAGIESE